MRILRNWRSARRLRRRLPAIMAMGSGGTYSTGTGMVAVSVSQSIAQAVHAKATLMGDTALAETVEPALNYSAVVGMTTAQRSMIRRIMRDATAV